MVEIVALVIKIASLLAVILTSLFLATSSQIQPIQQTQIFQPQQNQSLENQTIQPNKTQANENVGWTDIVKDFPAFLANLWDMMTAGVTGVATFLAKVFVFLGTLGLNKIGIPITLPIWIGYVAFLLIATVFLITQWEHVWTFVHHHFTFFLLLLGIIFILGIVLKMIGII